MTEMDILQEECDHHWLTDVQLGDYVECELCGLIFPKTELKKQRENENNNRISTT